MSLFQIFASDERRGWYELAVRPNNHQQPLYASRGLIASAYEAYYGIKTDLEEPSIAREVCHDAVPYAPISYWLLKEVISSISPEKNDMIFDIKCGRGRRVALFSRFPVKKTVGVEIDPVLANAAKLNGVRVRGRRSPIAIMNCNALDVDYSEGTIFFLYYPFGAETLETLLGNIRRSLEKRPLVD